MNQEKLKNISDITKISIRQLKKLVDSDLHINTIILKIQFIVEVGSVKIRRPMIEENKRPSSSEIRKLVLS